MCTLTYIPTQKGYTLTHNRDERQDRPTSEVLKRKDFGDQTIYYPEDLEAHGTWMAFSNIGRSVCLMNGGSETYERKENYRRSRGLVVMDVFDYESVEDFYKKYNFQGIEPFTMIVRSKKGFWKITHNEGENDIEELDHTKPYIWSSTTLYDEEARQRRRQWFEEWLGNKPDLLPEGIREFHKTGGKDDKENAFVMSREDLLKTLSITQIAIKENVATMFYEDFVQDTDDHLSLRF